MPHITVEYTSNIKEEANINDLLLKINTTLIAEGDTFPIGGIRSRAIELHDYVVADGTEDDAFVHVTVKIGPGRPDEIKKSACEKLFAIMEKHFSTIFTQRYFALSLELYEFSPGTMYRKNNIHQRYKQ